MTRAGEIRIGCSGWQYRHWKGDFYPADLPTSRWFEHYAQTFDTVEINNSFYRLPPEETFARWAAQAPANFLYAVKASRFLTHMKKLKDPEEPLARFVVNALALGRHLGPILYQLPPRWSLDVERLERFLRALHNLPRTLDAAARVRFRHAIEFRDPTWYDERVYTLLEQYGVALCLHDMQGSATGRRVVGPFVYIRMHFGEQRYGGAYDERRIDEWSAWIAERAESGLNVYTYFNNDIGGHAPRDAVRLRNSVQRHLFV
jgi:uncharacterized protein YecE (DUF72 family)